MQEMDNFKQNCYQSFEGTC